MVLHKTNALNKLESYKENLIRRELCEDTIKRYLEDIDQWFEQMPDDIRKEDFIVRKEQFDVIYEKGTLNNKITAINLFLDYLGYSSFKLDEANINFTMDVDNVITRLEYEKLLQYCLDTNRYKMYCLMRTLATTGIRISELKYVTKENVVKGSASVWNKKTQRKIYFSEVLQELLMDFCDTQGITHGYIFVGRDNNSPISRFTINKNLKLLAVKCNIRKDKVHPHAFRHLFAKEFLKVNSNVFELSKILGHKRIDTTLVYAGMTFEEKIDTLNKLPL